MSLFWPQFHQLQSESVPFCCVTLIDFAGSVPGARGAKMLVTREGLVAGTIGGGKIEARALAHCQEILDGREAAPQLVRWNLQADLGMTCGGALSLFFESYGAGRWPIHVFGAGHVAQALARVLVPLDCQITCYDARLEWLQKLPDGVRRVASDDLASEVAALPSNAFALVMTMGHATDLPVLRALLGRELPYVGVIGSKNKARALRRTLGQEGFEPQQCAAFCCPIGLPLGGNHPHEIAISIAAQLLQRRDGAE